MANLKSSKKDIRRTIKKATANKSTRTALRTYVKKVREAVHTGDATAITSAAVVAQKQLDKAVKRGVVHKNQAARRKSRIMSLAAKQSKEGAVVPVKVDAKAKKPVAAAKAVEKPAAKAKPVAKKAEEAPKAAKPKATKAK